MGYSILERESETTEVEEKWGQTDLSSEVCVYYTRTHVYS